MKNIVILIASALVLFSCIKNKTTTIEGILMASCDTPAANTSGIIKTDDGVASDGVSLSFTTDENGYFKVSHTGKEIGNFRVIAGGGEALSVWNLPGWEKDLGKVYINPFPTNFIIKLDVRNPYSANDTLVIRDFSSSNPLAQKSIPGPFSSGFLDSIVNTYYTKFPVKLSDIVNNDGPQDAIGAYIRSLPNYVSDLKYEYFYHAPICGGEFAEVTLVIE
jgi:hypothetical protein